MKTEGELVSELFSKNKDLLACEETFEKAKSELAELKIKILGNPSIMKKIDGGGIVSWDGSLLKTAGVSNNLLMICVASNSHEMNGSLNGDKE